MPGDLKLAANLRWLFDDVNLLERVRRAHRFGFRAVEIPDPYQYPAAELREIIDELGTTVSLINLPRFIEGETELIGIAADPKREHEFQDSVHKAVAYAQVLKKPRVHVTAGDAPSQISYEKAWEQYVLNIEWAASTLQNAGLQGVIEPQTHVLRPQGVLANFYQAGELVDVIGRKRVGLLFDFYHAQLEHGNITALYQDLKEQITYIQVGDAPNRTEPGAGELNWKYVFNLIKQSGYDDWIGCEYRARSESGLSYFKEALSNE